MLSDSLIERLNAMNALWARYQSEGKREIFIEFIVAVNSLVDSFNRMRLSGLVRICESLESSAFSKIADTAAHPLNAQDVSDIQRQINSINALVGALTTSTPMIQDNRRQRKESDENVALVKPRHVLIISDSYRFAIADDIKTKMAVFGFRVDVRGWEDWQLPEFSPLAVLFMSDQLDISPDQVVRISNIRQRYQSSQLLYLTEPLAPHAIVQLIRLGIDATVSIDGYATEVLSRVMDLIETEQEEKSRVLVVEDSKVAVATIERTLAQHSIDTFSIDSPDKLFEALDVYPADLILMDMHMPKFNGVEATRVLRQTTEYATMPIVYLSAESDVSMQVEALRLGGDQFLMKPFNPVLLAAVVEARIKRYRQMQRSTREDSLTGLLNHAASKQRLAALMRENNMTQPLSVAMVDIDHFKSINDSYGHPVGDVVIRALAYLLKGRLRSFDLVGRYGGEEYIVGLPGVGAEKASQVMNTIRADFAKLAHRYIGGEFYATLSAGVASFPHYDNVDALTEAADNALLRAKRLGRNRIESAEGD